MSTAYGHKEPIYDAARRVVIPALRMWFRWHLIGLENIPPHGPALLAFNHVAYLDPLAIIYAVDCAGRRPRFLTKSELFEDRRIAWVLRNTGQIEVRRGSPDARLALDAAVSALARGEVVVIFPEGTVTTDRDLRPMIAKSGVSRLALAAGVPVIPCGVWGTANVWPKDHRGSWKPGQPILVKIGKPFRLEGGVDSPQAWLAAGGRIMSEITALVDELRPLVPDRRRPRRARTWTPASRRRSAPDPPQPGQLH